MKPGSPTPGEVYAFPMRRGWGACQVLAVRPKEVEVVPLQFFSDERPSLADVPTAALAIGHHWHESSDARLIVIDAVPDRFVALGVAPVTSAASGPVRTYAHWDNLPITVQSQRRWDAMPEAIRTAFMRGRDDPSPVALALPGLVLPAYTHTLRVALGDHQHGDGWVHVADPASFDWRVFDALPCLTSLDVHGDHPGLVEWLRSRPIIQQLSWRGAGQRRFDLRGTGLLDFFVEPRASEVEVLLPDDAEEFGAAADRCARVTAVHADHGLGVGLNLQTWEGDGIARVEGLPRARSLHVSGFRELDLAALAGRWNPTTLRLSGAPGVVRNAPVLASLGALEEIWILQCVSIDADHFPPLSSWPRLKFLRLHGLAADEADALRKRLGKDRRVAFREKRDPAWIAANTGHPMLRWSHSPKRFGAAAAFTQAARKLATATDEAASLKALRGFVDRMNQLHRDPSTRLSSDEASDADGAWSVLLSRVPPGTAAKAAALLPLALTTVAMAAPSRSRRGAATPR